MAAGHRGGGVSFARLSFPLIEPDEARYALIAASMLDSGDLLVPQREGSYYLDKPPLLYWLTVASFWRWASTITPPAP